jgi:Dot/Icm secretion system protein IcmQ
MPNKNNKDKLPKTPEELTQALVDTLDQLLSKGNWEATLFLKTNKKKLLSIRSQAEDLLTQTQPIPAQAPIIKEPQPGYTKIYISLYQVDANNLIKWQNTIKALEKHSMSRPAYQNESDVKTLIRHKLDPIKEAYVVVFVKETDIVKPYLGKDVYDRFGNKLLTLKERAVSLENIIEFVHNDNHYQFFDNRGLTLIPPS